ncbi:hypothetical protein PoB_000780100 [Plakobranchus ocellatus]|uniref:Uncharacterized protein n=1 Tax=Plakobranchus ocellatus TaxID=259542 RepID=A0AAV3YFZ7_9GAST|nr:hypothetical protein PoB_000780100 [Plakobranchus ocellatus]
MVISGFQALRQARAPVTGLEPATEGSLQISGRIRYQLCHRRPQPVFISDYNYHMNGCDRADQQILGPPAPSAWTALLRTSAGKSRLVYLIFALLIRVQAAIFAQQNYL